MQPTDELFYQIALTLLPKVGPVTARNLISYCGSARAVFQKKADALRRIPEVGTERILQIVNQQVFPRVEKELEFIQKNNIQVLYYLSDDYPRRLKQCSDAPIVLYFKGKANLQAERMVAIVGTRKATPYGLEVTQTLTEGLKEYGVTIVSGLAYGIDIQAHKAAVKNEMATVGVVAHGLEHVYPTQHKAIAKKMELNGGLLTEFATESVIVPENFVSRNRIVAGICDAVIVVEAAEKGGALITADLASGYNRDVFAVPGRVGDPFSEGCNRLIFGTKAGLVTSAADIAYGMGWDKPSEQPKPAVQRALFVDLNAEETRIVEELKGVEALYVDELQARVAFGSGKLSSVLLGLEMKGVVRCNPGKMYKLAN